MDKFLVVDHLLSVFVSLQAVEARDDLVDILGPASMPSREGESEVYHGGHISHHAWYASTVESTEQGCMMSFCVHVCMCVRALVRERAHLLTGSCNA